MKKTENIRLDKLTNEKKNLYLFFFSRKIFKLNFLENALIEFLHTFLGGPGVEKLQMCKMHYIIAMLLW